MDGICARFLNRPDGTFDDRKGVLARFDGAYPSQQAGWIYCTTFVSALFILELV